MDWCERDMQAWKTAARKLRESGYTQKSDKYRNTTFEKGKEKVRLVRTLGKVDWHLVVVKC